MDPLIELLRMSQFSSTPSAAQNDMSQTTQQSAQPLPPDSSPDSPNNNANGSSPDSPPANSAPSSDSNNPVSGFVNGFLSGFTPSTRARDNLSSLMSQMPQYQPPGLFGKIEAGLIGATRGPDAAQRYLETPYNRQMQGWQNQVRVGQQLASDESQANNVGRSIAVAQQTAADREAKMAQDKAIADQKAAIAQQRADVYAFRYQNPDWKSAIGANGNLILYNSKDPSQTQDTGMQTNALTPDLRMQLEKDKEDAAMARTQATQAGESGRARTSTSHIQLLQDKDGNTYEYNLDTKQTTPVNIGAGGITKVGTPTKPQVPTTTESETKTTVPGTVLGSETLGKVFGVSPTVKSDKTTTTTKAPSTTQQATTTNITPAERAHATQVLTGAKHPVTEANIQAIVAQDRARSGGS